MSWRSHPEGLQPITLRIFHAKYQNICWQVNFTVVWHIIKCSCVSYCGMCQSFVAFWQLEIENRTKCYFHQIWFLNQKSLVGCAPGQAIMRQLSGNSWLKMTQIGSVQKINLNRHQTILQTFLNFFQNLTLPGVPHLHKQLPNGQHLSDLHKMCNLDTNLWTSWIGDHRILTYIFKWERLNTAGHSHSVSRPLSGPIT